MSRVEFDLALEDDKCPRVTIAFEICKFDGIVSVLRWSSADGEEIYCGREESNFWIAAFGGRDKIIAKSGAEMHDYNEAGRRISNMQALRDLLKGRKSG